jgi:hypothetical protein
MYRYKYATGIVNVGIKLLNTEMKETKNGHTGNAVQHNGFLFRKVSYPSNDAPVFVE